MSPDASSVWMWPAFFASVALNVLLLAVLVAFVRRARRARQALGRMEEVIESVELEVFREKARPPREARFGEGRLGTRPNRRPQRVPS